MPTYTLPDSSQFVYPDSYPYAPDPDDASIGISFLLNTYMQPVQFNGQSVIKTILQHRNKNYLGSVPSASIIFLGGPVTRREFGGGVENELRFELDFLNDDTNSDQAEQWVRLIYKLAMQLFGSQAVLQGANGSNSTYDCRMIDDSPKTGFYTQAQPFPIRGFTMQLAVLQSWLALHGIHM